MAIWRDSDLRDHHRVLRLCESLKRVVIGDWGGDPGRLTDLLLADGAVSQGSRAAAIERV